MPEINGIQNEFLLPLQDYLERYYKNGDWCIKCPLPKGKLHITASHNILEAICAFISGWEAGTKNL